MALVFKDRVQETTTTTGLGSYVLNGPDVSFQAFSAVGDGNTCHYIVTDGTDWESGLGTYTLAGTTLARTTIYESSNGGAAVNWPSGSKSILIAPLATFATAYYAHAADATLHFTEASIVHQNISGAGTNTHAQIDSHISATTAHGSNGAILGASDIGVTVQGYSANLTFDNVAETITGAWKFTAASYTPFDTSSAPGAGQVWVFKNSTVNVTNEYNAYLRIHSVQNGRTGFDMQGAGFRGGFYCDGYRQQIEGYDFYGNGLGGSNDGHLFIFSEPNNYRNVKIGGNLASGNPTERLEVVGNIKASGTITQNGTDAVLDAADIGVTVQGYDVDTAKLDVAQDWTAIQTFKEHVDFWTDAAVKFGADNGAHTRTNATAKTFRLGGAHYTNAEEPVSALMTYSDAASSVIYIGGGTAGMNAATRLEFLTAANTTTVTGTLNCFVNSSGVWQFSSTPNVGGTNVSLVTHNHTGVYEPADATILKDADIGVTVQAYNAANALTSDITYEQLNTNGDVGTGAGQLAIGNHTHTGVYEPADATILKDADIGVTVQGYDVDTAKLDTNVLGDFKNCLTGDRTLSTTANNYVELFSMSRSSGAHSLVLHTTVSDSGFSVAKTYVIAALYSGTSGYEIVRPAADSGPYSGNDYRIEINSSTTTITVRAARVSGATAGSLSFEVWASDDGFALTVNALSGTGTSTATADFNPLDADTVGGIDPTTILVDGDIGSTVQAYNANNALLSNITYEQLNTNGDVGTGAGQLAIGNHTHTGVYEPADATILKDADIGSTVQPQMSIQATAPTIGSVNNGHLWLNSDTGDTYVAFEDTDSTRQWILQSSPSNLLAQGVYARLAVNETVTGSWSFGTIDINGGSIDAAVIGGSSAAAGTFTTLTGSTSLTTPLVQSSAAELSLRAGGANLVSVYTNGTEKARFPSGGGQYLGTTTPIGSAFLSVNSGTTQASAAFTGNTLASELRIQHPASNVVRLDVGSGNSLAFGHNGSELARYNTLGQLMLGSPTVIPSWYTGAGGQYYAGKANYATLQLVGFDSVNADAGGVIVMGRSRSASVGTLTTTNSGDYLGTFSFEGVTTSNICEAAAFITASQDGAAGSSYIPGKLEFWVGNTSLVRHVVDINKNGQIDFNTTYGNGIRFAADLADADANVLDDYEEGTFTPILMDDSLSAGESQTASTQVGTYTKIGSFVYFELHLTMSSLGTLTTTQTARIGGLPFTSKGNGTGTGTGSIGYFSSFSMASSAESPLVYVVGSGTAMILYSSGISAANASSITVGEFTATGNIWLSGHYKTS